MLLKYIKYRMKKLIRDKKQKSTASFQDSLKAPNIRKFQQSERKFSKKTAGAVLLIVVAGILTGYSLFRFSSSGGISKSLSSQEGSSKAKLVVGSKDTKTFRDNAEGTLEKGGVDGEGTHKLIREGGESQTVYLTSSVLDMNEFIGKKVRVWGETFAARQAGWFMDVGRVEVLE